MIAVRHAWLQKHPSPVADAGEFHWYPSDGDRDLRASCVERMRGVDPPAVLWELAPGRAVWARTFAATAPIDGRRYQGVVLSIAEHADTRPAELLAALTVPLAEPWSPVHAPAVIGRDTSVERELGLGAPSGSERWSNEQVAAIARALVSGGSARIGDPGHAELATWIASIEGWMPDAVVAGVRRGAWIAGAHPEPDDRVAELVAAAWRGTATAAQAWRLLGELAEARGTTIDELAGELTAADDVHRALSDDEQQVLAGKRSLVDVLHAWGRGQLDQCPTAGTLTARLADAVALRVLARLVDGGDASAAIAEARWYALLPASRRATLLATVATRARSLRSLVEVAHA